MAKVVDVEVDDIQALWQARVKAAEIASVVKGKSWRSFSGMARTIS
jgi:hypothetical protein